MQNDRIRAPRPWQGRGAGRAAVGRGCAAVSRVLNGYCPTLRHRTTPVYGFAVRITPSLTITSHEIMSLMMKTIDLRRQRLRIRVHDKVCWLCRATVHMHILRGTTGNLRGIDSCF